MGVAPGVELDDRRVEAQGGVDLPLARLDEQRYADARVDQSVDVGLERIELAGGVEPALGGALLTLFGDDAGGVRPMRQRDRQHLLGRRHFQVQRQVDFGHQPVDILVGDVAPVLAQMRGDPVGARGGRGMGGADRIGMRAAARVPDGRDMVDVDAEAEPRGHAAARLPGLIAGIFANSSGRSLAS